jgi:predicted nucleotidyltransferase
MNSFARILQLLNDSDVRYVVVGGIAVVLHGYPRLTADLDLILDLDPAQARKAIDVLQSAGFVANVPIDIRQFANEKIRRTWIAEKNMKALSLHDDQKPATILDILADSPIPFDDLYRRAKLVSLDTVTLRIASIPDLIALKREAGRPEDLRDIEELEKIDG